MCDLKAFILRHDHEELLLESVSTVVIKDGIAVIRNLFGEEKKVCGEIRKVSLPENRIVIEQR